MYWNIVHAILESFVVARNLWRIIIPIDKNVWFIHSRLSFDVGPAKGVYTLIMYSQATTVQLAIVNFHCLFICDLSHVF